MAFGRIRADSQSFFLNTGKLLGIQSYSINNNFGNTTLKYIGFGNKPLNEVANGEQSAELSLQSYLIQEDIFIQQTGSVPINCFILKNQNDSNPYSLISGYLSTYSAKYSPGQIPQINSTFKFYNNAGNINTGNLDNNSFLQLSGISTNTYLPFNDEIANCNYINLALSESTGNRVLDFTFGLGINRIPIYNVGSRKPKRVDILYPINVSCDVTFEADDNFSGIALNDFPQNKNIQNIELDVYSHLSNKLMNQYKFSNMTMVSDLRNMNVDGNVTITRKYIGQIFNSIDAVSDVSPWDFGMIASGINYYLDWGYIAAAPDFNLDFGGIT